MKLLPEDWTTLAANGATIATAIFALLIWRRVKSDLTSKAARLEKYLKEKGRELKATNPTKNGAVNAIVISRDTGLTESEIFKISVDKPATIGRLARLDKETDRATEVIFFYKEKGENQ
jgi:sugar-specific transcriptional regulator TrmB